MYRRGTQIINASGLHARPASDFVKTAKSFESRIIICKVGEEEVNAKSIMRILTAGMSKGTKIEISAEGPDEKEAVDSLVTLIEGGFGE